MSPEQAQAMEVDQRSDIFSFGVVLYEMITGHLPFGGDHEAAVIYSIVNQTPEPLARYKANVPEGLQRVVEKALAKDRDERYQHIDGLLADLRHERRILESGTTGPVSSAIKAPTQKRSRLTILIPVAIVVLVVILFFILKPFQVKIEPQQAAIAQENSLAIMYFENLTDREDEERLGEIVTNLLITDLSESQYMRVVSSQRLYDILRLLGKEGIKVIDRDVATEVANRANTRYMLLGNILQVEPQVVLTSQLVEVRDGKVLASQRITGEPDEEIFSLVDRLTVEVKKDLSLPKEAHQERDPEIADVTTHSPEAYRHYVEGVECLAKVYTLEGEKSMRKAIECDSTFAMAYYQLSNITHVQNRRELIGKAMKYIHKVSRKEKMYIESMHALLSGDHDQAIELLEEITKRYPDEKFAHGYLGIIYSNFIGDHEKTIAALRKAIEIDPLYRPAYNWLAYQYDILGDLEQSLWAINKYIDLAPGEANPYDTRADIYANNGKIESAIESYQKALEIKPDFHTSRGKLGHMFLFLGEYTRSESCYRELTACSEKLIRSGGRTFLAVVPLYRGKLNEALQILEHGVAADEMEGIEARLDDKHFVRATIYYQQKNMPAALREIEKATEISHRTDHYLANQWRLHWVQLLVENGEIEKARRVIDDIERYMPGTPVLVANFYWCARGLVERAEGRPQKALSCFAEMTPTEYHFYTHYLLARAYLEQGKLAESVSAFEKLLSRYDHIRTMNAIASVKAHYYLGQAYERSGWTDKAVEQYEIFLEIWKNAEEGIEEIEIARKRVEALKAGT
jgi:tetratricopeptide (TPR) repeat protein/TolB-like protein